MARWILWPTCHLTWVTALINNNIITFAYVNWEVEDNSLSATTSIGLLILLKIKWMVAYATKFISFKKERVEIWIFSKRYKILSYGFFLESHKWGQILFGVKFVTTVVIYDLQMKCRISVIYEIPRNYILWNCLKKTHPKYFKKLCADYLITS